MPSPNDILSDPEINQAYEDVRNDKSETNWMLLKYEFATKDNLKLAQTGQGTIEELTEALGRMRRRMGPSTKVMRKAKMSFHTGQVKQVIRAYAIEIRTDSKKDLELDAVTLKLRKAMGANYDRQTTDY